MTQITEQELLRAGDQLSAEALAIAKCAECAQQSADPKLQQLYNTAADRHRGHYEAILKSMRNLAGQRPF